MQKRMKQKMLVIIAVVLLIIGMVAVFFHIPYSQTRAEFLERTGGLLTGAPAESGVFTEGDIARLPLPVQKYFRCCGYLGTPKMSYLKVVNQDVDFSFGKDKPPIKIDHTQYNFVNKPIRMAYIDSSMYGVPFEGLDTFIDGKGSMKGVLAKLLTLFNQTGDALDQASLVTYLSECLFLPNAALQDFIVWEAIDDFHAQATISYYGITAGGIFAFNEKGEMVSFTTGDRTATAIDGTSEKIRWSAVCGGYAETNGIRRPTALQAVWHYDDGDLIYFDGRDIVMEYDYEQRK